MAGEVKEGYNIAGEPFINFQAGFSKPFHVVSDYGLAGDQGEAVEKLYEGYLKGDRAQTLKGVTGSGKTFTMAKLIEKIQKPTLVLSHNKTLSAQLYREFKSFFPENAVFRDNCPYGRGRCFFGLRAVAEPRPVFRERRDRRGMLQRLFFSERDLPGQGQDHRARGICRLCVRQGIVPFGRNGICRGRRFSECRDRRSFGTPLPCRVRQAGF